MNLIKEIKKETRGKEMKKISILILSLFIITGCGDSSSGKNTTTRSGNRNLDRGGSGGGFGGSNCNQVDCFNNGGGNPLVGNSTSTPFSIGRTQSYLYNMRIGLEFYAQNQSSVEALGEMEVISASYGPSHCRLPVGYYDLDTVTPGALGTNGQVNTNHEYSGMVLEGDGPTHFRARVLHSLANNFGDDWGLRANLELLSVDGYPCNQYGSVIFSFIFPL